MDNKELLFLVENASKNWAQSFKDLNIDTAEMKAMSGSFIQSEYRDCDPAHALMLFGALLSSYTLHALNTDEMCAFEELHLACKSLLTQPETPENAQKFLDKHKKYSKILWDATKQNAKVIDLQLKMSEELQHQLNTKSNSSNAYQSHNKSGCFGLLLAVIVLICYFISM